MSVTTTGRTRDTSRLAGLVVLLFASLVVAAPAAQDPDPDSDSRFWNWAASGQTEEIRALLSEHGQVVVNSTDEAGWTALMHASSAGHDDVVRLLLDAGASVHLQNDAQDTALHLAAERGRTETARLLLEAGSNFMARDANGRTPLFRAIEGGRGEIVELLHTAALVNSSQQSPTRVFAAEGETVPPVIIQWTDTPYTDYGLKQGIEGTVVLMALVREDGSIGAVSVSKGLEESLDQNALRAVRTWKFDPATREGKPVVVVVEINVDFQLPGEP